MAIWRILALSLLCCPAGMAATASEPGDATGDRIVLAATQGGFERWKAGFRSRALAAGIGAAVFDRAFQGVEYNARVVELDGRQPEFTRTLKDYLARAVNDQWVAEGRRMASRYAAVLGEIERRFGVDRQVVLAIWGIETNFGGFLGGTDVIESLATLAYDGRRRNWAERELIAALSILQRGDTVPGRMEGSWAGAMGHTQFMPTSYLAYAADFNGDGRRDIWAKDPSDGLASTANYLRVHGWRKGQPWGLEVVLPRGFDYARADSAPGRPVAYWNRLGVRLPGGGQVPNHGSAGLWTPAGASGPAFIVFDNFFVIKRYNRADSYALAVGHLGDRIAGGGGIRAAWPTETRALSRAEKRELQALLTARGFDTQGVDGLVGKNTIAAIRAFQRSIGATPDGHPSLELLSRLR